MTSGRSAQPDIEEIMASFSRQNSVVPERTSNYEQTDSVDEVEIVKELKASLVAHQCDLCCEGSFLVKKLLQFGGVVNSSKKHGCEICCKGFWNKCDLSKHMKLHETGELNSDAEIESETILSSMASQSTVICEICTVPCKSPRGLRRHMTNQHSNEVPTTHVCELCMATFKDYKQFTRHCLTHTTSKQKLLFCSSCHKKFLLKKDLKHHVCKID